MSALGKCGGALGRAFCGKKIAGNGTVPETGFVSTPQRARLAVAFLLRARNPSLLFVTQWQLNRSFARRQWGASAGRAIHSPTVSPCRTPKMCRRTCPSARCSELPRKEGYRKGRCASWQACQPTWLHSFNALRVVEVLLVGIAAQ